MTSIRTCHGNFVLLLVIRLRACCTNNDKGGLRQHLVPASYLLFVRLPETNLKPRTVFSGSPYCNSKSGYLRNVTQQPQVLSRRLHRAAWKMLSMVVAVPLYGLAPQDRARGRKSSITACLSNSIAVRSSILFWGLVYSPVSSLPRNDMLRLLRRQEGWRHHLSLLQCNERFRVLPASRGASNTKPNSIPYSWGPLMFHLRSSACEN